MSRTIRVLSGLLMPLLLGCAFDHQYGSRQIQEIGHYLRLQPQVSTKEDVYVQFGQPADVSETGEWSQWYYIAAHAQIHGATFVPYIGLAAGGNTITLEMSRFHFRDGIYQWVDTSRTSRYQNVYTGLSEIRESQQHTEDARNRVKQEMDMLDHPFNTRAWDDVRQALKLRPVP